MAAGLQRCIEIAKMVSEIGLIETSKRTGLAPSSIDRDIRIARAAGGFGNDPAILENPTVGRKPKILIFDIETGPNLAYVWQCYETNVHPKGMVEHSKVMSWAAKWLGEDDIMVDCCEKDPTDERICRTLWAVVNEADIVVAHNGQAFDTRSMNTRWVYYRMLPPSPSKIVDTLKIARAVFRFQINKLDYIAQYLGIGEKFSHEGFELWLKCLHGDPEAWKNMREYNKKDVALLEQIYIRLRSWDKKHPNVALMYNDDVRRCIICGGTEFQDIPQPSYTGVNSFPTLRCKNCGKPMRTDEKEYRKPVLRHSL